MLRHLKDYDQSRFWQRLQSFSGDAHYAGDKEALTHLLSSVRKVATRAAWISTQICRHMPQYTLHEERHFLNVLAIMDALVPDEVLQRLTPLECALPILAAYTHDLGMALPHEEYVALQDESTDLGKRFQSYRSRYDKELRQAERWRKEYEKLALLPGDEAKKQAADCKLRADAIDGHILASYLRETHTEDETFGRLRKWLREIRKDVGDDNLYRYGQFNYERSLALLGIGHGRGANWLRKKLADDGHDDSFFRLVATGEEANLAFPGLLLRLADIMDFDASRAPRILFKHFGIENDRSVLEWNKNQAIVGWKLKIDPAGHELPQLKYEAECEHPVHEKSIREFAQWIDAELNAVRTELEAQQRHLRIADRERYKLHLAAKTDIVIRAVRDANTDQPKYVYHDLQFRLDQDEILQLLMGESLYGDPGLCIRELLQNALDALELRDLRLRMKQKGEAREPVDGDWLRPGWVREPDGREEELRVTLDWGTDEDTGQQWLRVTDNGVGMTEEVIKNYFTQIGKSYYRTPEFNQERAAMKSAGEVISPISVFGIGILSCFMIADRIFVRTSAGRQHKTDTCRSDIMVSGPGSLFWLQPGTLQHQGTEIKLYVKSMFTIAHDVDTFHSRLQTHFDYKQKGTSPSFNNRIDPAYIAASNAVWPKYPVVVHADKKNSIRVDERFHVDELAPIENGELRSKFRQWECPVESQLQITWNTWEFTDTEGPTATGSRIRLWHPNARSTNRGDLPRDCSNGDSQMTCAVLGAFVEPQLEDLGERTRILVNGIYVADLRFCQHFVEVTANLGSRVWIDLRGRCAPSLTANRQAALQTSSVGEWKTQVQALFLRMNDAIEVAIGQKHDGARKNLLTFFSWCKPERESCPRVPYSAPKWQHSQVRDANVNTFDFCKFCETPWNTNWERSRIDFARQRYLQGLSLHRDVEVVLGFYFANRRDRFLNRISSIYDDEDLHELCQRNHDVNSAATILADEDYRSRFVGLARKLLPDYGHEDSQALKFYTAARDPLSQKIENTFPSIRECADSHILQEAFHPDLASSWAPLELFELKGCIGDATLTAPAVIQFDVESDGRTVHFADQQGETPVELVNRGYDLSFPMTAIPFGELRRRCAEWRTNRWYRALGATPFVLPALHDFCTERAAFLQETFNVPHIYCLLPRFELWSKRFSDWTNEDWNDPENLSALWDLSGQLTGAAGQVLWARGTHDIHEIPKIGLTAPEFLQDNKA